MKDIREDWITLDNVVWKKKSAAFAWSSTRYHPVFSRLVLTFILFLHSLLLYSSFPSEQPPGGEVHAAVILSMWLGQLRSLRITYDLLEFRTECLKLYFC